MSAPPAGLTRVGTVHLAPGDVVLTTEPVGSDFGLPLVEATHRRRGAVTRVVRSQRRERGAHVVRFLDGTKTRPVHGRSSWLLVAHVTTSREDTP